MSRDVSDGTVLCILASYDPQQGYLSIQSRHIFFLTQNLISSLSRRLLARAKAGRAQRIQAERALEKDYVTKNDLKLDADTAKVQVAVFKLSKAGGLIESGYLALAAEALGQGSWETDLRNAGSNLGKDPSAFLDDVSELKRVCTGGDAAKAKKSYVIAARSLELFAKDTNTADNLKLL